MSMEMTGLLYFSIVRRACMHAYATNRIQEQYLETGAVIAADQVEYFPGQIPECAVTHAVVSCLQSSVYVDCCNCHSFYRTGSAHVQPIVGWLHDTGKQC